MSEQEQKSGKKTTSDKVPDSSTSVEATVTVPGAQDADNSNNSEDSKVKQTNDTGDNNGDVITIDDSNEPESAKKSVSDADFFAGVSEEEKEYYRQHRLSPDQVEVLKVQCTACWKQVNHHIGKDIQRHPVLGVPICRNCKNFYEEDEGEWEKDEQGSDCYCRWCGNGGDLLCCDKCTNAFCKRCIQRNLGRAAFAKINDSEKWECFVCDCTPIYSQRSLMESICLWNEARKHKKKAKEKEAKEKRKSVINQKISEEKLKKKEEEMNKVENFVDENIQEAFETLKIYQKCLEDEKKKWLRLKKNMTANNTASVVKNLRKIFAITKQNMELLDAALVASFTEQFPGESLTKPKVVKVATNGAGDISPSQPQPKKKKLSKPVAKPQSDPDIEGDDEIAVEEIVVNGEPVMTGDGFLDPSQLCSIQITADEEPVPVATPRQTPVKRIVGPGKGPLVISNRMFKKKSPKEKQQLAKRPRTPNSDIEEITIDDDDSRDDAVKRQKISDGSDVDSDVSLE